MSSVTYQSTIVQLEPFGGINHYWEYISIVDYQENVKREHVKNATSYPFYYHFLLRLIPLSRPATSNTCLSYPSYQLPVRYQL